MRLGGCLYLLFKPDLTAHFRVCYYITNSGNNKLGFTKRGMILSHKALKQLLIVVSGITKDFPNQSILWEDDESNQKQLKYMI